MEINFLMVSFFIGMHQNLPLCQQLVFFLHETPELLLKTHLPSLENRWKLLLLSKMYSCIIRSLLEDTSAQQSEAIPKRKEVTKGHLLDHDMIKYKLYLSGAVQLKKCAYGGVVRASVSSFASTSPTSGKNQLDRFGKQEKLRST